MKHTQHHQQNILDMIRVMCVLCFACRIFWSRFSLAFVAYQFYSIRPSIIICRREWAATYILIIMTMWILNCCEKRRVDFECKRIIWWEPRFSTRSFHWFYSFCTFTVISKKKQAITITINHIGLQGIRQGHWRRGCNTIDLFLLPCLHFILRRVRLRCVRLLRSSTLLLFVLLWLLPFDRLLQRMVT